MVNPFMAVVTSSWVICSNVPWLRSSISATELMRPSSFNETDNGSFMRNLRTSVFKAIMSYRISLNLNLRDYFNVLVEYEQSFSIRNCVHSSQLHVFDWHEQPVMTSVNNFARKLERLFFS